MPRLKAQEIRYKKFNRSLIGYNMNEVNDYLELIEADYLEQESNDEKTTFRLTAQEILNKKFNKSLFGYHIDQVNDFLDWIIKDYDELE